MEFHRYFKRTNLILILVVCFTLSVADEIHGPWSQAAPPAPPLQHTVRMGPRPINHPYRPVPQPPAYRPYRPSRPAPARPGYLNPRLLSGVGGIIFEQTAVPDSQLTIDHLDFAYNPDAADGQRLALTLNGRPVFASIPDWQLFPIALFADSPYYSCFSLWGRLADEVLTDLILKHQGHVMNYHPAFFNTLLGLRLYYMDILILHPFTADLPYRDGAPILGWGESPPDTTRNRRGLNLASYKAELIRNDLQLTHRGYVVTDFVHPVVFTVAQDTLKFSGHPYYYFWRYFSDRPDYPAQQIADTISEEFQKQVERQQQQNPGDGFRSMVIDSLLAALHDYEVNYNFIKSGTALDILALPDSAQQRAALEKYDPNSLANMYLNLLIGMDAYQIEPLWAYSDEFSDDPILLRSANPAVWDATEATMHWAAFFRFCKEKNPSQWDAFLQQIKLLAASPQAATPTVLYPKSKTAILSHALKNYLNYQP